MAASNIGNINVNLTATIDGFTNGLKNATGKINKFESGAAKATRSISRSFIGMTGSIVGVTGAIGLMGVALSKAMEAQKGFAEIATLGVQNMDKLKESVRNVSKEYAVSLPDATKAAYQAISAGIPEENVGTFLQDSAKAAKAGVTELTTAVDLGTNVLNAFGKDSSELSSVLSQAFVAVKAGKTTFEELASGVGKVAPTFAALGLTSNDLFASVAALTKAGVKTSEAFTRLNAATANILKPTKAAEDAAEMLGIQFNAAALQSKGLAGFLGEIQQKAGGNVQVISDLFGSVESFNAVLALTGNQAKDFNNILAETYNNTNALDEAYTTYKKNAGATEEWEKLKASVSDLVLSLGESLLPVMRDTTEAIKGIIDWIDSGSKSVNSWTASWYDFVAAANAGASLISLLGSATPAGALLGTGDIAKDLAATSDLYAVKAEALRKKQAERIEKEIAKPPNIDAPSIDAVDTESKGTGNGLVDSMMSAAKHMTNSIANSNIAEPFKEALKTQDKLVSNMDDIKKMSSDTSLFDDTDFASEAGFKISKGGRFALSQTPGAGGDFGDKMLGSKLDEQTGILKQLVRKDAAPVLG